MNDTEINYTKEAFFSPWNLSFLIMAMVVAFVLFVTDAGAFPNLALLFTAAVELLYLGIVPRNDRFRRAVRSQRIAEHNKPPSQKEIFQDLSRSSQRRYARLRRLEQDIEANYRRLSYASQGLLDSHLKKIDGLLDSYLNLLHQKERYETYARHSSEHDVIEQIADLREDMADDSARVKSIKERRLRILEQRLSRFKKGRENLEIIEAQLETVEDVIKYIHEQSWGLQNPDEITFQLDTLLDEVEETQASVREIEDVFTPSTSMLDEELLDEELDGDELLDDPLSGDEPLLDATPPADEDLDERSSSRPPRGNRSRS